MRLGRGRHGVELERFTVEHTAVGLARLWGRLRRAGVVVEVGIERPDGAVVDALLGADLTVLVIPPKPGPQPALFAVVRPVTSADKDDSFDAFVLADTLRTDRAGLQPLRVDSARLDRLPARRPAPPPPALTEIDHMRGRFRRDATSCTSSLAVPGGAGRSAAPALDCAATGEEND